MTTLEDISTMAQASGDAIFGHFQVEEITTVVGEGWKMTLSTFLAMP